MAKLVRVTLLNGETCVQQLPDGMALPQWWKMVQADSAVIGETWCARWESISHAAVVSDAPAVKQSEQQPADTLSSMTSRLMAGAWKSPHEA